MFGHKHFLGLENFPREDIQKIIDTAFEFKDVLNRPIKKVPSLQGVTIVNLFFENSTRTRISFELAQKRLSADTVNFSASTSSLKKGESFKVGRYHSLKLKEPFKSNNFEITMRCLESKVAMSFENNIEKIYGFQFHPESFLTINGNLLIKKILSA